MPLTSSHVLKHDGGERKAKEEGIDKEASEIILQQTMVILMRDKILHEKYNKPKKKNVCNLSHVNLIGRAVARDVRVGLLLLVRAWYVLATNNGLGKVTSGSFKSGAESACPGERISSAVIEDGISVNITAKET